MCVHCKATKFSRTWVNDLLGGGGGPGGGGAPPDGGGGGGGGGEDSAGAGDCLTTDPDRVGLGLTLGDSLTSSLASFDSELALLSLLNLLPKIKSNYNYTYDTWAFYIHVVKK